MLIRDGPPSQNEMAFRPPFGRVASCSATFVYLFGSKLLGSSSIRYRTDSTPKSNGARMSIYDHLEFKHLKYIVSIADNGTFTAAAAKLPLAQSALSRSISEMEDALGIQVFDRSRDGVSLTDAGESLLAFARELLQTRIHVVKAVQAIQQTSLHPFKLGFSPFVEQNVLGEVCSAYRELFPKSVIEPESGDTDELVRSLRAGEIDAALVTLPLEPDGYKIQAIMHEPLVVCVRKDDPLAHEETIDPEQLSGRLGIFSDPRHHPRAHERLLEMLSEQGIKPRICKPTFNQDQVQWMVRENLCVALVRQRESLHDDLTTRPIRGVKWTVDSAIVYEPDHKQIALPLLIRELEKRFSMPGVQRAKKAPQREVESRPKQDRLFIDDDEQKLG